MPKPRNHSINNDYHTTSINNDYHTTSINNDHHTTSINNDHHTTSLNNDYHTNSLNNDYHTNSLNNDYHTNKHATKTQDYEATESFFPKSIEQSGPSPTEPTRRPHPSSREGESCEHRPPAPPYATRRICSALPPPRFLCK